MKKLVFLLVFLLGVIMFGAGVVICYDNLAMILDGVNRYQLVSKLIDFGVGLSLVVGAIVIWVLNNKIYYAPRTVKNPFAA